MKTAHELVVEAKQQIAEIGLDDAELAVQRADVVIDVREPDEYQSGHLPGAINIPRGMLEFRLSNDDKLSARDLNLVLYCKTSGRAALSALSLKAMGYLHVLSIAGGFDAWVNADKPVTHPNLPDFE
ncbi:hypothetical protein GCM10011352_01890 [Marinobacterium zhoushanense]|uniref:Rhodanese domain-containing protein n=1 Tax=Marinobacterium zhoushanense TaxID=1679163 RepID=A0ABQ1JWY0_9GAMM|nr:rhodanese-like domain-containing protein [Marinobacterium zhoushanense]GGB79849.1 hypothetical protein GCM10011352_01890 [Marinobacterium zhoushanense]